MGPGERFRRWRHSRGFGIHSPFAYRLVKEAICPDRGYLYYEELTPRLSHPLAAMTYRIGIFLAGEKYSLKILNTDLTAAECPEKDEAVIAIDPSPEYRTNLTELMNNSGHGLIIDGRRYILAVPRKEMAFIKYILL